MNTVYVVVGVRPPAHYGEETQQWYVCAYPERFLANQHADALNHLINTRDFYPSEKYRALVKEIKETLDPEPKLLPTWRGNYYFVASIPFALHLDDFKEQKGLV